MITDAKGAIYQHLEYFPYGETWIEEGGSYGGNTPGYKFTGKELDPETGLYYFGARYYEPKLSKWISADPILGSYLPTGNKEKDGSLPGMGGVYNPVNLGLYTYTHLNPVRFVDPQGTDPENPDGSDNNVMRCHVVTHNDHAENFKGAALIGGVAAASVAPGAMMVAMRNPGTMITITAILRGLVGEPSPVGQGWGAGAKVAAALEEAANSSGPTLNLVTKLTQAPEAGRALSVWVEPSSEVLANVARSEGQIFSAQVPVALVNQLKYLGIAEQRITSMGGVTGTELRIMPEATEFLTPFFKK